MNTVGGQFTDARHFVIVLGALLLERGPFAVSNRGTARGC